MAIINVLEFYLTATNQRETDSTPLKICVIFESVLVFLPLIYLVAFLSWKLTRRYHVNIRKWLSSCYLSTRKTYIPPTNDEEHFFDDVNYVIITERAAELQGRGNDDSSAANTTATSTH